MKKCQFQEVMYGLKVFHDKKAYIKKGKIERAKDFNYFNELKPGDLEYVDPEEFAKKEIYDEFIRFKCLNCKKEETLESDIVFELFDEDFEDFPVLTCPFCGEETYVPKYIFNELSKKKNKPM